MTRPTVDLRVERRSDHLDIRWRDRDHEGGTRFDRAPGTRPEWIGEAAALTEGAPRRTADAVLDAVAAWACQHELDLGVWHEDGSVERLQP